MVQVLDCWKRRGRGGAPAFLHARIFCDRSLLPHCPPQLVCGGVGLEFGPHACMVTWALACVVGPLGGFDEDTILARDIDSRQQASFHVVMSHKPLLLLVQD